MKLTTFNLYFNTIKFLKLRQIYWLLKYRFFKSRPLKVKIVAPNKWLRRWNGPRWSSECWDGGTSFFFLEEMGVLKSQLDWNIESKSDLWLYNLHYLDCLNLHCKSNVVEQKELINNWIHANYDIDKLGWNPYCLALRIINLIKWCSRNDVYSNEIVLSIGSQAEVLMTRIEYHLLGNHLFANGKALIFAGAFLKGEAGQRFLNKGLKIIDEQIDEQFLSDGGHFELSPMYHQILMWDVCDLVLLAEVSDIERLKERCSSWRAVISAAEVWRGAMMHPDSEVAFFNDSAMGIAPPIQVISDFLEVLDIQEPPSDQAVFHDLKASGFFSISQTEGHKLLINACEISPTFQPGHSHADSLSFELSVHGKRLLVNSGTSVYAVSDLRQWQRSTCAHNTLTFRLLDSSQVWGGFRVAKRAQIVDRSCYETHGKISIEAAHDGFVQQSIGSIHRRRWISTCTSLTIVDEIRSKAGDAVAHFFLHPDVSVTSVGSTRLVLKLHMNEIVFEVSSGQLQVLKSKWYPKFGVPIDSTVIIVSDFYDSLTSTVSWETNA